MGDAKRVREVGHKRGYPLMHSGNGTLVGEIAIAPLPPLFSDCWLFSDTDMDPKVFWQSSALYRGQKDTLGVPSVMCVCQCVSVLLSF